MPPQMEDIGQQNIVAFEDITNEVKKNFTILESYVRSDGAIEYKLSTIGDTKEKFLELCGSLKEKELYSHTKKR